MQSMQCGRTKKTSRCETEGACGQSPDIMASAESATSGTRSAFSDSLGPRNPGCSSSLWDTVQGSKRRLADVSEAYSPSKRTRVLVPSKAAEAEADESVKRSGINTLPEDCTIHTLSFLSKKDVHSFLVSSPSCEPTTSHNAAALLTTTFPGLRKVPVKEWLLEINPNITLTPMLVRLMVRAGADVNAEQGSVLLKACGRMFRGRSSNYGALDRTAKDEQLRCDAVHALLDAGANPQLSGVLFSSEPTPISCFLAVCDPAATASTAATGTAPSPPPALSQQVLRVLARLIALGAPTTYYALTRVKQLNVSNEKDALRIMHAPSSWYLPRYRPQLLR
jgi:hypothetical protein